MTEFADSERVIIRLNLFQNLVPKRRYTLKDQLQVLGSKLQVKDP